MNSVNTGKRANSVASSEASDRARSSQPSLARQVNARLNENLKSDSAFQQRLDMISSEVLSRIHERQSKTNVRATRSKSPARCNQKDDNLRESRDSRDPGVWRRRDISCKRIQPTEGRRRFISVEDPDRFRRMKAGELAKNIFARAGRTDRVFLGGAGSADQRVLSTQRNLHGKNIYDGDGFPKKLSPEDASLSTRLGDQSATDSSSSSASDDVLRRSATDSVGSNGSSTASVGGRRGKQAKPESSTPVDGNDTVDGDGELLLTEDSPDKGVVSPEPPNAPAADGMFDLHAAEEDGEPGNNDNTQFFIGSPDTEACGEEPNVDDYAARSNVDEGIAPPNLADDCYDMDSWQNVTPTVDPEHAEHRLSRLLASERPSEGRSSIGEGLREERRGRARGRDARDEDRDDDVSVSPNDDDQHSVSSISAAENCASDNLAHLKDYLFEVRAADGSRPSMRRPNVPNVSNMLPCLRTTVNSGNRNQDRRFMTCCSREKLDELFHSLFA